MRRRPEQTSARPSRSSKTSAAGSKAGLTCYIEREDTAGPTAHYQIIVTTHRPPGLYEELITRRLEAALEEIRGEGWREEIDDLDAAEAPGVLARFIHDLVEPLLGSLSGDGRTARQLEIVNSLVETLRSAVEDSPVLDELLEDEAHNS